MTSTLPDTPRATPAATHLVRASRGTTFDLLRVPGLGHFLLWRHSRSALQIPVLVLGLIMIAHAFWGPQLAPKNLAALLTWVHFRGMVVLVILFAGNLFCLACPFLLPREVARRWFAPRWEWPKALRNKWPAIGLFVLVLFLYELFDLWSSPWWTGVLIVGYFALATAVDALFHRASFCKFVCPVGQFNFLSSTLSPWEVAVRDPNVCHDCQTKDCIRGVRGTQTHATDGQASAALPIIQRGCELDLFQPRKVGNLDCTFCLDCVHACPHENIGILARLPADGLVTMGTRSGIGKLERRSDYSALMIVFTFGDLLNAFAMTSPVYALEQAMATWFGLRVEWPILMGLFAVALVIEPALLVGGAAWSSRRWSGTDASMATMVNRFARSLVPLGFGIWLAHYGFHFFTGFLTVIPVAQHAVAQSLGRAWLGEPQWQLGGFPEALVFSMEIGFLSLGLIGSWLVSWSLAQETCPGQRWPAFLPWAALHALLFAAAVWILNQPMDMRGTFLGG